MSEQSANGPTNSAGSDPEQTPAHEAQEMLGSPVPETPPSEATERDPSDWVTGDDPATEAQKTYLDRLAREAGEEIPADVTKAEASEHIDRLQAATGTEPRSE